MKRVINLLLVCVAIVLLPACSAKKAMTSSTMNVNSSVIQYPTVADLEIKPKVEKTMTWQFYQIGKLSVRKGNLVAEMVKENDADILLEPQVSFTKTILGPRTLTITGYPAKFKNFRKATESDLKALNAVAPECHDVEIYNMTKPKRLK